MFSQASVILFEGRGHAWQGEGVHWRGVCIAGGVYGGGHAWQGTEGCAWQGACVAGGMAIAAGGTHTTGMHSRSIVRVITNCLVILNAY